MSQTFGIPDANAGVTTNGEVVNIGMASRDPLPVEREAYPTLQTFTFAYDALAIVVSPDVTGVTDLSRAQLHDIYTGTVTNWMAVGGPDAPIAVVARNPISGTAGAWNSLVMHGDPVVANAVIAEGNTDVPGLVVGHAHSIGYVSAAFVTPSIMATVTELTVEGVAPTTDALEHGSYSLVRPLEFVTSGPPTPIERAFIAYCFSAEGQGILQAQGEVPAPAPQGFP
jgi:phosphate transport system substrate-binding protein